MIAAHAKMQFSLFEKSGSGDFSKGADTAVKLS